jgi:cell division protein FtsB
MTSQKVNGDDIVVHQGDQVIPLEQRLETMQRSIRRLTWLLIGFIAISILHALVGPEQFQQIIQSVLDIAT